MKVVIAIDSFKGSMSSMDAGLAAKAGVLAAKPDAHVIVKPLADGGEGTADALIEGMNGEKITVTVTGPMGAPVNAYYGYLPKTQTAIIEMAAAAGITLVPENKKDPLCATTRGVGEMIVDAMERGCKNFIIGIGGSATNDGGIGMLKALGYEFFDSNGNDVGEGGQALIKIASIKAKKRHPLLSECHFQIACDVKNPLYGPNGATYIYGPQKGVSDTQLLNLDTGMINFAQVTAQTTGHTFYPQISDTITICNLLANIPGAGAAGGLGFAFLCFTKCHLAPGIELILNAINFENEVKDADVVITGEGRLDHQTAMGKAPVGIAFAAKKYGTKVIAFAGSVTSDARACNDAGIDAFFPIVRGVTTLEEAMKAENARENLKAAVEQVFRLL